MMAIALLSVLCLFLLVSYAWAYLATNGFNGVPSMQPRALWPWGASILGISIVCALNIILRQP